MSDEPVHLTKSACYDEDAMWCTDMPVASQTRKVGEATCVDCLLEAMIYGAEAGKRFAAVSKKRV